MKLSAVATEWDQRSLLEATGGTVVEVEVEVDIAFLEKKKKKRLN